MRILTCASTTLTIVWGLPKPRNSNVTVSKESCQLPLYTVTSVTLFSHDPNDSVIFFERIISELRLDGLNKLQAQ